MYKKYRIPFPRFSLNFLILFVCFILSMALIGCQITETAVAAQSTPPAPTPETANVDLSVEILDITVTETPNFTCNSKELLQGIEVELKLMTDKNIQDNYTLEINELPIDSVYLPMLSANQPVTKTFSVANFYPHDMINLITVNIDPVGLNDDFPDNNEAVATINRCGTELSVDLDIGCTNHNGIVQEITVQVNNEGPNDFPTSNFNIELLGVNPNGNTFSISNDLDFTFQNQNVSPGTPLDQSINVSLATLTDTLTAVQAKIIYTTDDDDESITNFITGDDESNNVFTKETKPCADFELILTKDCSKETATINIKNLNADVVDVPFIQTSILITSTETIYDENGLSSTTFITNTIQPEKTPITITTTAATEYITATLLFENDPILGNNTDDSSFKCTSAALSPNFECDPEQAEGADDAILYTLNVANKGTRIMEDVTAVITATYNTGEIETFQQTIDQLKPSQSIPIPSLFSVTPVTITATLNNDFDHIGEIPFINSDVPCANLSITASHNCQEEDGLVVTLLNEDANAVEEVTAVITRTKALSTTNGIITSPHVVTETVSLDPHEEISFSYPTTNTIGLAAEIIEFEHDTDYIR